MPEIVLDEKIQELLEERKVLSVQWRKNATPKSKRNEEERHLVIIGDDGHEFKIIVRENQINPLRNFSVILGFCYPEQGNLFHLRRYNGNSHRHTNAIPPGQKEFDGFHIHYATEKYQIAGEDEDDYAKRTDRYQDISGALECLMEDANVQGTPELFKEVKRWLLRL